MTEQHDNHKDDVVLGLTSDWFDGQEQGRSTGGASSDASMSLDSRQVRRMAELRLVHSLLLHLSDRNDMAKEQRIARVMESVAAPRSWSAKLYRTIRPFARYAIAAALLVACVVFYTQLPVNTASAAVDRMIAAFDNAGDRTYRFTVQGIGKDGRPQPEPTREPGERAGLDGSTLYLRSSDKFVLARPTPSGKSVLCGSDGQTRWLIRPDKPVLVSSDPQAFRIPMPPELAAILSMNLKATLLQIRDHYRVRCVEDASGQAQQTGMVCHLIAEKVGRNVPGPGNIEIWADAKSGLLHRIEFAGIHLQGDPSLKRLIIELVDQKQLPDDWFTRQAHQEKDAQVDFLAD
jgi:hypothetical protein